MPFRRIAINLEAHDIDYSVSVLVERDSRRYAHNEVSLTAEHPSLAASSPTCSTLQ